MGKGDILLFTAEKEWAVHSHRMLVRVVPIVGEITDHVYAFFDITAAQKNNQLPSYRLSIMCSFFPRQDLKCRLRLPWLLIFSGFLNSGFVCQRVNRMLAAALRFVMVDCSVTHTGNEHQAGSSGHTYSWGYLHVESNPPYEAYWTPLNLATPALYLLSDPDKDKTHRPHKKTSGGHKTKESQIQIRGAHQKLPHCLVCACLC